MSDQPNDVVEPGASVPSSEPAEDYAGDTSEEVVGPDDVDADESTED